MSMSTDFILLTPQGATIDTRPLLEIMSVFAPEIAGHLEPAAPGRPLKREALRSYFPDGTGSLELLVDQPIELQPRLEPTGLRRGQPPTFGCVSLSLDVSCPNDPNLSFERELRARAIVEAICDELRPIYGYATDEDFIEGPFRDWWYQDDVQAEQRPRLLSWWQYFSDSYLAQIGLDVFREVGMDVYRRDHGAVVALTGSRIRLSFRHLHEVNLRWTGTRPSRLAWFFGDAEYSASWLPPKRDSTRS